MNNYKDTENKIIGNLLRTPLERKSQHQLAQETKLSYVTVHKIIPTLVRKKFLKLEKQGRANLISVDLEHAPVDALSAAIFHEKNNFFKSSPKLKVLSQDMERALASIFYCAILFGSYAQGKEKKDSDIDLLFIVPSQDDTEKYREKINKALTLIPGEKHIVVVSTLDFIDMLNQKNTVGRAAFQRGIVLFGTEQYYAMVKAHVRTHGH